MKRILCIIVLIATLLSAFSVTAFADDNAQSGSGDTGGATSGYGWYTTYQYLWKVTIFVSKSDQATKSSSLTNDFHRIGTVILKKNGWNISSSVQFGSGTKVDYYSSTPMSIGSSANIISEANCPAVPIACDGNIEAVKSYFGSTGTMSTVLNAIASARGTTVQTMLTSLTYTIGGQTRNDWSYEYLEPNATTNRVHWVIVYEPMVIMNCKDRTTKLAFTATEFAISEQNGWYDWNWTGGAGQGVSKLTYQHLPTSVQLEESWFGYPVYAVTKDSQKWSTDDIIKGGGWGMRWLSAAVKESDETDPSDNIAEELITPTQKADNTYDFSVSAISVSPSTLYQGNYCEVSFVSDNWNMDLSYSNILVEILVDGSVVKSDYVNFSPFGRNRHSYSILVDDIGTQTVTARINWSYRYYEDNSYNNSTTVKLTVKPKIDLSVEEIDQSSDYKEETQVVTSFRIYNNSEHNILPSHNNTVKFVAYYYNGSRKVVVSTQYWHQAVIPAYNNNLVYFKWTVPNGTAGKKMYCEATVNADNTVDEYLGTNNVDTLTKTVGKIIHSQTPDTQYEEKAPSGFVKPSVPSTTTGVATWSMWVYNGSSYVKKNYGLTFSSTNPTFNPDSDCPSAEYKNGKWYMKSGYGLQIEFAPTLTSYGSRLMPSSSAYTPVQNCYAIFPEFKYKQTIDNFRTLELVGRKWMFVENENADGNERLHFIPLWYPDGNYVVQLVATEVWTPGGRIRCVRNANLIEIIDSAYDDWYIGR